jgi:D-alanine-D-alanine ligase
MRVLIVHNEPVLPETHPEVESERGIEQAVASVKGHLVGAGFEVNCMSVGRDRRQLIAAVEQRRPDVVFNLFEGLADDPDTEARVAETIESLGVPLTGAPSRSLRLAGNKSSAKSLLAKAGLPTPKAFVVEALPIAECRLNWPVIAKPALYDASTGIDQASVATDASQLAGRIEYLLDRYAGSVLVEEFISGREFSVAVVELPDLRALPTLEIQFVDQGCGHWPLLTYDAKWKPGSRDYQATLPRYQPGLPQPLARTLEILACRAFRLFGCRDYARIDLRLCPNEQPYILEVNPNPDVSPTACLAGALTSAGLSQAEFVVAVVRAALRRGGGRSV